VSETRHESYWVVRLNLAPEALGSKARTRVMVIEGLALHRDWITTLARWHFDQWGPLTGSNTIEEYVRFLDDATRCTIVPSVLVASLDGEPAGSATLLRCDMEIRNDLAPWLGQLFVAPAYRKRGIGAALVRAVAAEARRIGYDRLHLYTSGELPRFYERLGWSVRDRVHYLGKERVVMQYDIAAQ
jgi:GNAT superfamily N-acetyltransferase